MEANLGEMEAWTPTRSGLSPHWKAFLIVLGNSHSESMAAYRILSAVFVRI
ncbi:MAG: hypothetical protein J6C19_05205 [Lachnospiraceae bacterium]|nr:hypothetical protein [Lachnospiraceae bacterium]